jgi:hypothetical protein
VWMMPRYEPGTAPLQSCTESCSLNHTAWSGVQPLQDPRYINSAYLAWQAYSVRMQAKRRSRHRDGPEGGARQLMYNIGAR